MIILSSNTMLRLIEEAKVLGERANEDRRGGRLTMARRHYKIALLKITGGIIQDFCK